MCYLTKEYALVIEHGKCSWGKCLFCGWGKRRGRDSERDMFEKTMRALRERPRRLKIFTSGSFFDDSQFPPHFRTWLAEVVEYYCVEELQLESLPDFITYEKLQPFLRRRYELILALGLEVADDGALKELGKYPAMSVEKYVSTALLLRNVGVKVKTYLLVNPPIANWREKFEESVKLALKYSDEVVLINTYPHSESPLFKMWIEGKWRPLDEREFYETVKPWLGDPRIQIDFNNFAFKPRFPKWMRKKIRGANKEALLHPYYEVWQDFLVRFYKPPKEKDVLLLVPCSYRKPYPKSKTWRSIKFAISGYPWFKRIHMVAVSSPGVVPEEFSWEYPFNAYDWPEWEETEEIKRMYVDVIKERVKKYLKAHKDHYKKIFAYFKPDSESMKAVKRAAEEVGVEVIECLDWETYERVKDFKPPVAHPEAIKKLKECLKAHLSEEYLVEQSSDGKQN